MLYILIILATLAILTILWEVKLKSDKPRPLGLSDLLNFIKLNNGSLRIMSNDIYYKYNRSENYSVISKPIIGTLISITIIADNEHTYVVKKKEE